MLVLSRRKGEKIVISHPSGPITVEVVEVRSKDNGQVRLGVTAPQDVSINREEVQSIIDRNG